MACGGGNGGRAWRHAFDAAFHDTRGIQRSVIVPQYGSCKITVFVWGKNTVLKFLGNTKQRSMKLTLQLVVVVLMAPTKFRDNLR